ncbi:Methyltransferase domain-containing protein [Catalinimonas alkaloidigena]|uniref:Methyltransferase domain-containing protein n=1 Tax=Catalinimonas alkaloidigena TaxID=1075417 RepID=A0A1G9LGM3_9BACT|nr:class I SAM-dependent methyltransferase [Catalinimonas alkaloidigena]SDL61100.1 Methyltransferase domain-containing protein [Catalinimonas alkaloidigena]
MTWEETIEYIRKTPAYASLVRDAYLDADLAANVVLFRQSEEFQETLRLLRHYHPQAQSILDIGSGNGISAVAFSLEGYRVTAVEPDPSETIGAGAIRRLKTEYNLSELEVYEALAEEIQFADASFDVVYVRQAMHHARDLKQFVKEAGRVLKKDGLYFTVRDHVVFNDGDKVWFLDNHPLQQYYGGENAFTPGQYQEAIIEAGIALLKEFQYYDSVLNYFPLTTAQVQKMLAQQQRKFVQRQPFPLRVLINRLPWLRHKIIPQSLDERKVPGRMYSYIGRKQ